VTLDLTGLPPSPAEVDAFLADADPGAYERAVDRLLASPRYGERMAVRWLDAARYADTNGYQSDGERVMWRWRDWVIDAFNRNLPYDRFTIEQLAGDLLPDPTLDQRIATGFNRNHRGNGEGGIIPEEYAVEYVADRVETTATVWLGLTVGCARCHDHKFDPVPQRDFYRLFAFFNNVPEKGKAVKFGNSPPVIASPTPAQQEQLRDVEARLAAAEAAFARLEPDLAAAQAAWEKDLPSAVPANWFPEAGLLFHLPLDGDPRAARGPVAGAVFREGLPSFVPGRLGHAAAFDGRCYLDAGDVGDFGFLDRFSCGAWVFPTADRGTLWSRMADVPESEGYQVRLEAGRVQVNLVKRWLDDALRVETEEPLPAGHWRHLLVTYDGSRVAAGIKVYVDGRPARLRVLLDDLNQSFQAREPFRLGAGGGPDVRFRGLLDDLRVYGEALSPADAELLATTDPLAALAATPAARRSPAQAHKLRSCFLAEHAPARLRTAWRHVLDLRAERRRLTESFPTTMVMEELPTPRPAFVLARGQYDRPGERVTAGVPARLPPLPPGAPANRLGLARWLVAPAHPLTARVTVNRFWQMLFGTGLVKTAEDFGAQGEWPSHPELLDWLATELVGGGWDVKALLRTVVTSSTYRQSSRVTPALLQRDPENRLLARGPRLRLPAEMIRDQALAASGLLVERFGGPSVRPYQPPGLWKELTGADEYVPDRGEGRYRRGLYTFWKRTVAPPAMLTFDAAGRETCTVRETRTNTPLQALNLLNDPTYLEAARALARRVLSPPEASDEARTAHLFRSVLGRAPRPAERDILVQALHRQRAEFQADPSAAKKLVGAEAEPVAVREGAAYTALASLVLNLDEALTKE
jgi:Protein of unknown function (DUF1553)/Protein of unknown function (DUF1549)/Concanavalin A-like lectin/glucanases superfamily